MKVKMLTILFAISNLSLSSVYAADTVVEGNYICELTGEATVEPGRVSSERFSKPYTFGLIATKNLVEIRGSIMSEEYAKLRYTELNEPFYAEDEVFYSVVFEEKKLGEYDFMKYYADISYYLVGKCRPF